jgi:hypothetical protein
VFSSQTGIGDDHEPGVDDAGDPAEDGQDDVDEEGAAAAFAQEDGEGREEDCYYCFAAADLFGDFVRRRFKRERSMQSIKLGSRGTYDHHVCGIDSKLSSCSINPCESL